MTLGTMPKLDFPPDASLRRPGRGAVALPWLEAMGPLDRLGRRPPAAGAGRAQPHGVPLRAQRQEHGRLDAEGGRRRLRAAAPSCEPLAAGQGRAARADRPDRRQGPRQRRRRRRPRPRPGRVPHRLPAAQDRRHRHPGRRLGRSGGRRRASATRRGWPSLEIGCERGAMAGNCDSGYSCVYSSTMSWRSATQPLPKEVNPKLVFERLFGTGPDADRAQRDAQPQEHPRLRPRGRRATCTAGSGASDRRKLDEYFAADPRHRAAHRAGREAAAGRRRPTSPDADRRPGRRTRSTSA